MSSFIGVAKRAFKAKKKEIDLSKKGLVNEFRPLHVEV